MSENSELRAQQLRTREVKQLLAAEEHKQRTRVAIADHTGLDPLSEEFAVPAKTKPIIPPAGIKPADFNQVVEAFILHYALTGGIEGGPAQDIKPQNLKEYCGGRHMTVDHIGKIMSSKQFYSVMVLRGVKMAGSEGLSGEQMRALSIVLDVSTHLPFDRKLKKAGVSRYQWQTWLNDPQFRAYHDRLSSNLFTKVQADVDAQVASGALNGKLDFIKYFNDISGKHTAGKRTNADIQQLLNDFVEIITKNVQDREVLLRISAELQAAVAKLG